MKDFVTIEVKTPKGGNFRWQLARPKTLLSMIGISNMLPFCLEFSIATMSTLQRSSHVELENYNVPNVQVLTPQDDKSLHKAAAAVSEAAWSPRLVVTLLSLLVFPDLSH